MKTQLRTLRGRFEAQNTSDLEIFFFKLNLNEKIVVHNTEKIL